MNNTQTSIRLINLESDKVLIDSIYKKNINECYDLGIIKLLSLIKEEIRIGRKYNNKIDINKLNFDHICMQVLNKGIIINTYKLDIKKKKVIDDKKKIYVSKNNDNNLLININQLTDQIFEHQIINKNITTLEKSFNYENLEDIKKEMERLSDQIKKNNNNVETKKRTLQEDKNKYYEELKRKEDEEKELRLEKEKEEEKKRIFQSDISIYRKLLSEINKGERNKEDIPELFVEKFEIFSMLEQYNKLDEDNVYEEYIYLEESIDKNSDNNNDFDNIIENNNIFSNYDKDYIQHNINFTKKNNILSLQETLDNISSISDSNSEEESDIYSENSSDEEQKNMYTSYEQV
jgi:hypothetical protein